VVQTQQDRGCDGTKGLLHCTSELQMQLRLTPSPQGDLRRRHANGMLARALEHTQGPTCLLHSS
jgi:hypothetical protein